MEVCHHYRIPHSVFLGRAPAPGEPAWLDDDQDKALAYQARLHEAEADRASSCPSCGTLAEDWIDPDSGMRLARPKWIVELEECPGCRVIEAELGQLDEDRRRRAVRRLRLATEADFEDDE